MSDEKLLMANRQPEPPGAGTKRVNRIPLLLVGSVMLSFFLIMAWVAANRTAEQQEAEEAAPKLGNSEMFAQAVTEDHDNRGIVPPDVPQLPAEKLAERSIAVASDDASDRDEPPLPPGREKSVPQDRDEDAMRVREARLQMLEQGLQSKTGVQTADLYNHTVSAPEGREEMLSRIGDSRRQAASLVQNDPTKAYKARLEMLRGSGVLPDDDSLGESAPPAEFISRSAKSNFSSFDSTPGAGDRWQLPSEVEKPRSRYELRAGFVIPAIMISGINSNLPGQVIAQVSQDVFDTATGKYLVIPQGTRLIGAYSSDVGYGQERVMMAWQRLVYPDGRALDLGAMPGADRAGYSGFSDQINNHYIRTFSSAFLMSGVIAAVSLSQDRGGDRDGNNQRAGDALSEALGQTFGNTMSQMIMKNLNIAPTLEIRPGFRFNVMVTKDMPFERPYKIFEY